MDAEAVHVIGNNGKWPLPKVEANVGNTIVVHTTNKLGRETMGLHWHGQFQTGTNNMDGPVGFTTNPAGSFWYHFHASGQYPDGLRGPMWYHEQMPGQVHYYLSTQNEADHDGAEPIPQATLINDKMTERFKILPGKRYLVRIISMSALASHFVRFDGHQLQVIAVDGVPVKAAPADTINISAAQRHDVTITGRKDAKKKNYAFVVLFDPDMFDFIPGTLNMNSDESFAMTRQPRIQLPLAIRALPICRPPYITQKVPTLFTALTTGQNAVQVVVINLDDGGHPFHMYGHNFQVMARNDVQPWDGNTSKFPQTLMRRDTIKVPTSGSLVLRFRADKPGSGLSVTFIESPIELQKQFPRGIPEDHENVCRNQGIPIEGNCSGNTRNVLDTSQCVQKEQFDPNPWGALINPPSHRRARSFVREIIAAS
ncbi:Cupredoxin [Lophiotrema nucula]|uniref:Cupredoxin n=1 Tax=Lophiotrema nucula TaxID=690887 RepID=A0A6A5ZGN1_9PLEO|nr:Cupredoxin [Lophiotrema nucula]